MNQKLEETNIFFTITQPLFVKTFSLMITTGQAVNVLREEKTPHYPGFRPQLTSHISIPACYKSGVTLYIRKSNPAYKELRALPELAFKPHHKHGKKHHQR